MAYSGTHQDINMLMLYPWPEDLRFSVSDGQLGRVEDITFRQYLALVGEHWEHHFRYPRHKLSINFDRVTVQQQVRWGQLWGLAVRAMLERGYLDFSGGVHPPVPFADPPPEYRTWDDQDGDGIPDDQE